MPRLVRRAPLAKRIRARLDPWDFLLWLSEELNSTEWEDTLRDWSVPFCILMNIAFMIARSNSRYTDKSADDVFGDYHTRHGSGWLAWFCSFITQFLIVLSVGNAYYTFSRKRHYRLFESSVEVPPSTPSARRVRVDSSPVSSSPLRFLSKAIAATSAESRAHPDETRDVWELAVWDPTPLCLRLFCLFSPGHVLVYWLFLPVASLDPRPSVTVVTTIFLGLLLSIQLHLLQSNFSQQTKDAAVIHKEVLHEYDTKFVHPSLNQPVRDVGIQTPDTTRDHHQQKSGRSSHIPRPSASASASEVDTYPPTTIINRGFYPNPNPNYAPQYDPDNKRPASRRVSGIFSASNTPPPPTPLTAFQNNTTHQTYSTQTTSTTAGGNGLEFSSPIRGPPAHIRPFGAGGALHNQPQFRPTVNAGDGGSLGVYSHGASPLRKTASANYLNEGKNGSKGGHADRVARRAASPVKRYSDAGVDAGLGRRMSALRGGNSGGGGGSYY